MMHRILVYHMGGLGDFITLLPLLSSLKQLKNAAITLLGKPLYGNLAKANSLIDTIIDADSSACNHLFIHKQGNKCTERFFSQFEELILFTEINSPLHKNATTSCNGRLYRQDTLPDKRCPITEYRLKLTNGNNKNTLVPYPDLSKAIQSLSQLPIATQVDRSTVALHPGSGSKQKNWPIDRFITVANQLRNAGLTIIWFTGPAESAYHIPACDRHYNDISLIDAASIVAQCRLYIGNDSGFSHLAAASGCPAIVLFAPSDPVVWAPRGRNMVTVIHHPSSCSPCHLKPSAACSANCMYAITIDEVVTAAIFMLKGS